MPPPANLYLIRHEDAEPGAERDDYRALTGRGRRRLRTNIEPLIERGMALDRIITSPLVRAVQTSEILAAGFALDEPVDVEAWVAHPPTLDFVVDRVVETPASSIGVAVVGHEPTMGVVACHLLAREMLPFGFGKGSVMALSLSRKARSAELVWFMDPSGPHFITD